METAAPEGLAFGLALECLPELTAQEKRRFLLSHDAWASCMRAHFQAYGTPLLPLSQCDTVLVVSSERHLFFSDEVGLGSAGMRDALEGYGTPLSVLEVAGEHISVCATCLAGRRFNKKEAFLRI